MSDQPGLGEAERAFFAALAREGSAPTAAWPRDGDLEAYGLRQDGGRVVPAVPYDPLRVDAVRGALSGTAAGWLQQLEVHPVIGSTNAELMARARQQDIDGTAVLAELQVSGRGRRGRGWFSPFGANLAVSVGFRMERAAARLGGVSLVVGLAVLDALESLDVTDLALKWPNDVLRDGAKLGGILIEMVQAPRGVNLIVGIGINVRLPPEVRARLDQAVADLGGGAPPSRSVVAGRVVSAVADFLRQFESMGFAPFRAAFDERHHFHGRDCRVLQGDHVVTGRVRGVSDSGGLLLEAGAGVQEFHGGEVSLRIR